MKRRKVKVELGVIGTLQSCYKEKFGVPRQSGMVSSARGVIKLEDDPDLVTALKEMGGFSHLWVVYIFHEVTSRSWKPTIRPPRLGGVRRVGVLASRSPHRPNPIGLSVVKIEEIRADAPGGPEIEVSGVDILDGSPILDIKPYVPYADCVPEALSGWAAEPIPRTKVTFTPEADAQVGDRAELRALIEETLGLDPRPASQRRRLPASSEEAQGTRYGFNLLEYDVKWEIRDRAFVVLALGPRNELPPKQVSTKPSPIR